MVIVLPRAVYVNGLRPRAANLAQVMLSALEIQCIIDNDREDNGAEINPVAAEHCARPNNAKRHKLFEHKFNELSSLCHYLSRTSTPQRLSIAINQFLSGWR